MRAFLGFRLAASVSAVLALLLTGCSSTPDPSSGDDLGQPAATESVAPEDNEAPAQTTITAGPLTEWDAPDTLGDYLFLTLERVDDYMLSCADDPNDQYATGEQYHNYLTEEAISAIAYSQLYCAKIGLEATDTMGILRIEALDRGSAESAESTARIKDGETVRCEPTSRHGDPYQICYVKPFGTWTVSGMTNEAEDPELIEALLYAYGEARFG